MRHICFLTLSLVVGCRTSAIGGTESAPAATYWQDHACTFVKFPEEGGPAGWTFCVDKVVLNDDGPMEFHVRWIGEGLFSGFIDKGSDAGNRNMYVVDDRGRRYDHIETRGAAAEETRLDDRFPQAAGTFVFPGAASGATAFAFKDDDQQVEIEGISLSPQSRTSRESSLAKLEPVSAASMIRIGIGWQGLGTPVDNSFVLARTGQDFVRREVKRDTGETLPETPVPLSVMETFLRALSESPILDREYLPTFTHTDDYPHASIEVETPNGVIRFSSESQGPGMIPWKVEVEGKSFVVPDDAPARALRLLSLRLPEIVISVRDERPSRSPNVASTGDLELVQAARYGDVSRIRALLASGAGLNERNPYDGSTAIQAAVMNDQPAAVRALVAAGASPNALSKDEVPPLVLASIGNFTDTLRALIEAGCDVDARDPAYSETALLIAAKNGYFEGVKVLAGAGADVNATTSYGGTALMQAARNGYPDLVAFLLGAGADVNRKDEQGATALMQNWDPDAARMLIDAGADFKARDARGNSVLVRVIQGVLGRGYDAVYRESTPIDIPGTVRVLLEAGADPNVRDPEGRSALALAREKGQSAVVDLLVAAGATP
jgi:ankyrin repeat protein